MIEVQPSEIVWFGRGGEPLIRKTPGVCGGEACIRNTRIMVWLLVALKKGGMSDEGIIAGYPGVTAEDIKAAWDYFRQHPREIEEAIAGQELDEE